jgi:hypothetical protein
MHGQGMYVYADGSVYEGEWSNDKKSGYGVQKDLFGVYSGQWVRDVKSGHGSAHYLNGDKYAGMFGSNLPEGQVCDVM